MDRSPGMSRRRRNDGGEADGRASKTARRRPAQTTMKHLYLVLDDGDEATTTYTIHKLDVDDDAGIIRAPDVDRPATRFAAAPAAGGGQMHFLAMAGKNIVAVDGQGGGPTAVYDTEAAALTFASPLPGRLSSSGAGLAVVVEDGGHGGGEALYALTSLGERMPASFEALSWGATLARRRRRCCSPPPPRRGATTTGPGRTWPIRRRRSPRRRPSPPTRCTPTAAPSSCPPPAAAAAAHTRSTPSGASGGATGTGSCRSVGRATSTASWTPGSGSTGRSTAASAPARSRPAAARGPRSTERRSTTTACRRREARTGANAPRSPTWATACSAPWRPVRRRRHRRRRRKEVAAAAAWRSMSRCSGSSTIAGESCRRGFAAPPARSHCPSNMSHRFLL